jgi:hypothetical protein
MKKIFTLCILAISATFLNAQVVLNEIYTDPGNGKNEFFEFYNTSSDPVPQNLDNYTLVAYYEESGKTGFYVLDLPNQTVASKGYYVGSSANPFKVQGQSNVPADFNWNAMPAGGYLKKFERSGATYTQVAVPANLNDLFVARSGTGCIQHILVFQNGLLINGVFTGTNFATIPNYIKSMPPLFVDMSGASPDFTINFNSYNDNQFEYVNSAAGNDNGYMRLSDGKCGVWAKSSSAVNHTPGQSNGSASGTAGDISINYYITDLGGDYTKAMLVFNVTASTLAAFPVTIQTYEDYGVIGQLDASDVIVESRQLFTINDGDQFVILPSRTNPVIITAKTPSGCFDQVIAVPNTLKLLPVNLVRFQGNMNKSNKVTLNWTVTENETVNSFEIERSFNGRDFTTVGLVFSTEKRGTENYMFYETVNSNDKVMYRLKMIDKGHDIDYSRILIFLTKTSITTSDIKVYGNPVKDKLTFSYYSNTTQPVQVKVYDLAGKTLMSQKVNSAEGSNMLSLPLTSSFKAGMYVVEVTNGADHQIAKFIKQ